MIILLQQIWFLNNEKEVKETSYNNGNFNI